MEAHRDGEVAARRVHHTLEIRQTIFQYLDRKSLLEMFVLEKAIVASIASIIYREVHLSDMRKLNRSNVRS